MRRRSSYKGFRARRRPNKQRIEHEVREAENCSVHADYEADCASRSQHKCAALERETAPMIIHNHIHIGHAPCKSDYEHRCADGCHCGYVHRFLQWQQQLAAGLPPWLVFDGANTCMQPFLQPCPIQGRTCMQPFLQPCPIQGWCGPPVCSAQLGAAVFTQQCA